MTNRPPLTDRDREIIAILRDARVHDYIPLVEAARRLGMRRDRLAHLAREGRIPGAQKLWVGIYAPWMVPVGKDGLPIIIPGKRGPWSPRTTIVEESAKRPLPKP